MNGLLPLLLTAMLLSPTLVLSLPAQILAGKLEILDGDTLRFGSERVRLEGVDALESRQHCLDSGGKRYRCGLSAREALKEAIGSRPVRCEGSQRDRYGRLIAVCFDAAGTDLNGWLVTQGWTLAYRRYSKQYVPQEETAQNTRRGVWAGHFVKPWQWRRGKRLQQ